MLPCARRLVLVVLAVAEPCLAADEGGEFFEKKVRPLLVGRCYECHSEERKIKGGLRLDLRAGWQDGGNSGPALVPGKPNESLLLQAVRYGDPDLAMPPDGKLPKEEIAILEEWIRRGAPDPRDGSVAKKARKSSGDEAQQLWSYAPLKASPAPDVTNAGWAQTDIDRFILAKLEAAGLTPATDAEPAVLVRRAHFALLGLPPAPERIDAFVQAAERDFGRAWGELVDELLASPHFGERWGRRWLDLARFAESTGGGRSLLLPDAWRYRDYVVESFNQNVPIDRFIREQIAGDLLPAADLATRRRQLTATGFMALGAWNYEEQDKQQLRFDIVDEQLDTIGKALLAQTISCARCHDHKFDPISHADYYALAGILASTRSLESHDDELAKWITVGLPLEEEAEAALRRHEADLVTQADAIARLRRELADLQIRLLPVLAAKRNLTPAELPGIATDDGAAYVVGAWQKSATEKGSTGNGFQQISGEANGNASITFRPRIVTSGNYRVWLSYSPGPDRAPAVKVSIVAANGRTDLTINQQERLPGLGTMKSLGVYRFEELLEGFVVISNTDAEGVVVVDALTLVPEKESVDFSQLADLTDPAAAESRIPALQSDLKKAEAALTARRRKGPHRPRAMSVRDEESVGDVELRLRGQVHQLGPKIPRGFLHALAPRPAEIAPHESGRRELAAWITSPENPLTSRVFVNRVWGWLFGAGLVRTVDNFGTTGEKPSHHQLLDTLALRFTASNWDLKKLIREIMLSRAWRMSSAAAGQAVADPDNRLLSYFPRRALEAEELRDAMLAASGQLDLRIGGLNIKGVDGSGAPAGPAQRVEFNYVYDDTRRSLYTPAFRAKRLEFFETFDFADINSSSGARNTSTVAPQALFMMNHPFILQHAKATGERIGRLRGGDEERLRVLFRSVVGRAPAPEEAKLCLGVITAMTPNRRSDAWARIAQALFGSIDFRFLD